MSYDVSFRRCFSDTEGQFYLAETFNMTSNVGPMYRVAGLEIGNLDKMLTKNVIAKVQPAYDYMVAHSHEMRTLEPANGWGKYEDALGFLQEILVTCLAHPECFVEVSV